MKRSFKLGYCEGLSISRWSSGELLAGQASALVTWSAATRVLWAHSQANSIDSYLNFQTSQQPS